MDVASINFRMEKELKSDKKIPFEIEADPFYSKENQDRLRASMEQMERTGGTVHEVDLDD